MKAMIFAAEMVNVHDYIGEAVTAYVFNNAL